MRILVVGGAGYIGAHMCRALSEADIPFAVLDDFSTGHEQAVDGYLVYRGSLLTPEVVDEALRDFQPDLVMHFAAKSLVGESVQNPAFYYRENVQGVLNLLDSMRVHSVKQIVFSSTASVYGTPDYTPIDEEHTQNPINPYGRTKLYIEKILQDYGAAYGIKGITLRYFNAAGAHASGDIGEDHEPETHLIPNIIKAALNGTEMKLFGDDYPTDDGFCIRDYIHVEDLCQAHLLAGEHFSNMQPGQFEAFNLGTEQGTSVKQVLDACEKVLGKEIAYSVEARRPGDVVKLVAAADKAKRVLGWKPEKSDMETIISSACKWHAHTLRQTVTTHYTR